MRRAYLSLMLTGLIAAAAHAAKSPSDYYRGQQGGVSDKIVEALRKDIPMAKRVLC